MSRKNYESKKKKNLIILLFLFSLSPSPPFPLELNFSLSRQMQCQRNIPISTESVHPLVTATLSPISRRESPGLKQIREIKALKGTTAWNCFVPDRELSFEIRPRLSGFIFSAVTPKHCFKEITLFI